MKKGSFEKPKDLLEKPPKNFLEKQTLPCWDGDADWWGKPPIGAQVYTAPGGAAPHLRNLSPLGCGEGPRVMGPGGQRPRA